MIRQVEDKDWFDVQFLFKELTGRLISKQEVLNRLDFVRNSTIDSLYLYEINGLVIGLLGFRIRENIEEVCRYGEFSVLIVNPLYRKQGIGKQMLEFAEQLAMDMNCKGTWLVSGFGREEKAHKFYQSLGYEKTGYRFVKQRKLD